VIQQLKSRTIRVMIIMAGLEGAVSIMHWWEPIINDTTYAAISSVLGIATAMIGVYMRTITTIPLSQK